MVRGANVPLLLFCALRAACQRPGPGVLERLVGPTTRSGFLAAVYEQRWEHFPHDESLVPITLGHISEWITLQGDQESVIEVLPHPVTERPYKASKKQTTPLQRIQDAFLQGHSMVINSLHRWSEPGMRLTRDLYDAADLPVDTYMYLTPPHSRSYGVHSDVMDAFMVQLEGSKSWKLCGREHLAEEGAKDDDSACQDVTMRGGDVLYLPFGTLHGASTADELSMHLTVNVERQFYVWSTLLIAILHKIADPALGVDSFVHGDAFNMEDQTELLHFMQTLMRPIPRLTRLPLASTEPANASRWLARPLSNADLPEGYLERVLVEYHDVVGSVTDAISASKKTQSKVIWIGQRKVKVRDVADLLRHEDATKAVPWALELARLHAVRHFIRDEPERILRPPELFSSLAAARASTSGASATNGVATASNLKKLLSPGTRLARRHDVRAVLLLEGRAGGGEERPATLEVNGRASSVQAADIPAVNFCLGLFGEGTAQGRPFTLDMVPGSAAAARSNAARLVSAGALRILAG